MNSSLVECSRCRGLYERKTTRKMCPPCNKEYNQINKAHIKIYNKQRYEHNKDVILAKIKTYHTENKESIKEYTKKWFSENKDKVNEYTRNKYANDTIFKLKLILRNILNKKLKQEKNESSLSLIGCKISELKTHLESQFFPEMNWQNHGEIWEIDHILPCSSFDLTQEEEQNKCFHYTNLQPLFKTTEIAESFGYTNQIGNRNKSNKLL